MERTLIRAFLCTVMFLMALIPASPQATTGAIVGTLTDPGSAAVPNGKVVAIEERTNLASETITDPSGAFSFPALRPGLYRLEAEASGFRKLVRSGIELSVNDRLRIDLSMTLGPISESIQVTGSAPLIESESATLGNVIENRKIVNLPLNTRNRFQLALLSPGRAC